MNALFWKASELRALDVINVVDGRKLGRITDLDVDLKEGKIRAIILPGEGRSFWPLDRYSDIAVPWEQIVRIGADVILVELDNGYTSWRTQQHEKR